MTHKCVKIKCSCGTTIGGCSCSGYKHTKIIGCACQKCLYQQYRQIRRPLIKWTADKELLGNI